MRVLVVEDEPAMQLLLRDGLREHGHTVLTASDGLDGLQLASSYEFDVVVLDILLPKLNGHGVAQALREQAVYGRRPSILMLTACDAEDQIIHGLEIGADDYLTKPFSFLELLARIQATTRFRFALPLGVLRSHDLEVDTLRQQVHRAGRSIALTPAELRLTVCLLQADGAVVPRAMLIRAVWGQEDAAGNANVDTLMSALRNKLDVPFTRRLIQTVRGVGYRLSGDPQDQAGGHA